MHLETFLTSALLLLIVTLLSMSLFKHFGLGSVLGLLIAGIIVGPYSPGPYVTKHVDDIRHFTELGVVLLLFVIGLEMRPRRLWAMRRDVFGLGTLQVVLTGVAIGAYFLLYQPTWQSALLIGLTFSLSSTAFVLQTLQERGEFASRHGTTAFSILLMQDMAIVPLLALIPLMSETSALANVPLWEQVAIVIGMLGLITAFGLYILPVFLDHLARQGNQDGFLLAVIFAVFVSAWATHFSGASMALGAFLIGVLLSGSRYRLQIQASIEPFKGILMNLFFVTVGMSINLQALAAQLALFVQHIVVIVAIKVVVLFLLVLAFRYSRVVALKVSLFLAQGGEFGFVLFGSAKAMQVIDDATFVIAIGVTSITMLATPILVHISDLLSRRAEPAGPDREGLFEPEDTGTIEKRVIIGGYGRVGHAVATLLHGSGIPFIAFDTDPMRVAEGRRDELPVYYGDIGDPQLLLAARVDQAALVVLTIDHSATALRAVSHIRASCPNVRVIARARDLQDCGLLMEAGASHAFPEAVESSLRLGGLALELINVPEDQVEQLLQGIRSNNYELIDPVSRGEKGADPAP